MLLFWCESSFNNVILYIYIERLMMLDYYVGIVSYVFNFMFNLNVKVMVYLNEINIFFYYIMNVEIFIKICAKECMCCKICFYYLLYFNDLEDLCIGFDIFCEIFFFYLIMNRNLEIS